MWDMNDVVEIEYKEGFVYRVVFDDGKKRRHRFLRVRREGSGL